MTTGAARHQPDRRRALAIQAGVTAGDLAWPIDAHPTLPEAVLEAALGWWDSMVHHHKR
jgi:hypothetical protein